MSLLLRHSKLSRSLTPSSSIRNSSLCLSFRNWHRSLATSPSWIPDPSDRQPRASPPSSGLKALRNSRNSKSRVNGPLSSSFEPPRRIILGQSDDIPIRTRFAPSPTGLLHLGSLRTALFNKLSATASQGGAFVLRIEDTDQSRLVPGAEESLIKDLTWAGLTWDEGPGKGGPYGPYRQSERLPIYQTHVRKLLDKGHAYRCFCSPDLLESQKLQLHEAGKPTFYPGTCRSIDAEESEHRARQGESHVVRLKVDRFGHPRLKDAIYGPFQKKDREEDFILVKTDGFPTYHFANVVDDHLMKITHVIRGEEWLISTPKHIALYNAFGWDPPTFAHLGLLINPDGTKLSKRHASVDIAAYKEEGIFPIALLSWLAHHGSSFKSPVRTPCSIEDLANALTFKFTRGGIKLNSPSLANFNQKYRAALLWKPLSKQTEQEADLIDELFTRPMLLEIQRITDRSLPPHIGPASSSLPEIWNAGGPLEPVPSLQGAKKSSYVVKVLRTKQGGFQDPTSLLTQHPYLFFRVPPTLYVRSLTSHKPDARILNALDTITSQNPLWIIDADGDCALAMDTLRSLLEPQGLDQLSMHNALRLVAAGQVDVATPSSAKLFAILGREEWAHRLEAVRGVIREEKL